MNTSLSFSKLATALALAGFLSTGSAQTNSAGQDALIQKLDALQQELNRMKAELNELKNAQTKTDATAQKATVTAQEAKQESVAAAAAIGTGLKSTEGPATVLTGYGELNYNRYRNSAAAIKKGAPETRADARRIVLGVRHRFNDDTKFVGEFEFEHGVTSASDQGEVAIEQAYIEHRLRPNLSVRGGLFLVPLGFLNERHEPTAYYGVERNFVETAIIPSTWREGGVMMIGNTDSGFEWKAGLTTGFDLNKWDSSSRDGKISPLASVHQELSLAKSKNLSVLAALDWRGMPGLTVGGGIFTGKAGHSQLLGGANPTITIWDLHARWTPGKWDLSALYAAGSISGTSNLNIPFASDPTPIPSRFDGGYVQAAYHLWQNGNKRFSPFARLEKVNTAAAYALFPAGLGRAPDPNEVITTVGASYIFAPGVVLKADLQQFKLNKTMNRFNLGLGYSF